MFLGITMRFLVFRRGAIDPPTIELDDNKNKFY